MFVAMPSAPSVVLVLDRQLGNNNVGDDRLVLLGDQNDARQPEQHVDEPLFLEGDVRVPRPRSLAR
jgi:hypothetical protein